MQSDNPYASSDNLPFTEPVRERASPTSPLKVSINPFELIRAGYEFIKDEYWLFFGLTLVCWLMSSLVPFGLIMGPMLVGLTLCYMDQEEGKKPSFELLFKGFDSFGGSFLAYLIHLGIILVLYLVIFFFMAIVIGLGVAIAEAMRELEAVGAVLLIGGIVFVYGFFILLSILIQFAMFFTMSLIADKKVQPWDSVKLGYQSIGKNFVGILLYAFVAGILGVIALCLCFLPLLFLMPVLSSSNYILYRQIFPRVAV